MYKILEKTQFSEKVFKFRIEAPAIAKHAHAGQFLMVRANETGERVPFTLAGWNGDEGWVEFIFMVIDGVHHHAAVARTTAEPTLTTCLTGAFEAVVDVRHDTHGSAEIGRAHV